MNRDEIRKIILVVIDALRIDRINEKIMPFLVELSRKSVTFDNAFTTINTTDPSLTAIYSGRYPSSLGLINHGEKVTDKEVTRVSQTPFLHEVLGKKGFITIGIDFLGRWHRKGFKYYWKGFEYYSTSAPRFSAGLIRKFARRALGGRLRPLAKSILRSLKKNLRPHKKHFPYDAMQASQAALNYLNKFRDKKMFLLIHYWDTHTPYPAPLRFVKKFTNRGTTKSEENILRMTSISKLASKVKGPWGQKLVEMFGTRTKVCEVEARYDAASHYVDKALKTLYEGLKHLGLLDETLLIITSDHGESLIEHDIFFDHHGLYDVTIRVPLIMYSEAFPQGRRLRTYVQHVDLAPTVLNLLGIKTEIYFEGFDLLPLIFEKIDDEATALRSSIYVEESYTQRKFALRTTQYKYIEAPSPKQAFCRYCGVIHGGVEELYDLIKDPDETSNIINISREMAEKMKMELNEIRKRITVGTKIRRLKRQLRKDMF